MKLSLRLLTLLLCFELIVAPVVPQLSTVAWADDKEACSKQKGKVWDSELNQCLTSQEVSTVRNAVAECKNKTTAEDQKACYASNAQAALDRANVKDNRDSFTNKDGDATFASTSDIWSARGAANAATVAVPLFFLIKTMNDKKARAGMSCKPASLMLMYSGGAALLLGEVLTYLMHNKKLDKMKNRMSELKSIEGGSADSQNSQATQIQSEAFELLAQNEDSIADIAKTKKVTYLTATGLFAAGTAMAVVETFQLKTAKAMMATCAKDNSCSQHTATIKRITCGTQYTKEMAASDQSEKDAAATKESEQKTNEQKALNKTKETAEKKQGFLKEMGLQKTITQAAVSKGIDAISNSKKSGQEPDQAEADALKKNQAERQAIEACEAKNSGNEVWQWINGKCEQVDTTTQLEIKDILNLRYKRIALNNIESSTNGEELLNSMFEFEAIEFENYSKTNYINEEVRSIAQNLITPRAVVKFIAENMMSSAHAGEQIAKPAQNMNFSMLSQIGNIIQPAQGGSSIQVVSDEMQSKWNKAVYAPVTRIAINGLLGGWMGIMSSHMAKQQKVSKERAEVLRKMKEDFNYQAGIMNCSEADRKSTSKPYCYCYTSDNQRNPARANSTLCNKIWGTNSTTTNPEYMASNTTYCVDKDYGVDTSCSCKNRKSSDGKNSCLKVGDGYNMSGINPGTFKMLSVGAAPANDLFNGNASAGSLDTPGLANNAMKLKKAADEMAAKSNPEAVKTAKDLEKSLLATTAGMSMNSPGSSSSSPSLAGMTPSEAAKALEEELKDSTPVVTHGGGNQVGGTDTPAEPQLEFGMTPDQLATQEEQVAEAMKQNLDYGDNDINKGSKTNIFEVLSNRYQRSGMRRLFEGGEKVAPDKPSNTDINQ